MRKRTPALMSVLLSISGIANLCGAQQPESLPRVPLSIAQGMMTVHSWRICGPFVLSRSQNYTFYSHAAESDALARDRLHNIGGVESPLFLPPPTSHVHVDFAIDVKNQPKDDDTPSPAANAATVDQVQDFPSGTVSSQTLYWGLPRRFAITYAAAELAAPRPTDVVFIVSSNSPLKIWLNNVVVADPALGSAGHNWSDYQIVKVALHSGTNTILVKMFSFPERNDFSFHIGTAAQASVFLRHNTAFLDLLNTLVFPDGSPLSLSHNLRYLVSGRSGAATMSIATIADKQLFTRRIDLKNEYEIPIPRLPDGLYNLTLKIHKRRYTEVFYLGDVNDRLAMYRSYCSGHVAPADRLNPCVVLQPLLDRMTDPQMTQRLDKEKPLLLLLSQFEWSLAEADAGGQILNSQHFYLESYKSAIDGTEQYYYLHLPAHREGRGPVPLVIVCPYDDHRKPFLVAPTNTMALVLQEYAFFADRLGFAVLVPYARGLGMSSPLGLKDVVEAIDKVESRYAIDTTRVYLTGDCAGGRGALILAEHYPARFAAVSTLNASTHSRYIDYGDDDDDDDESAAAPADDGLLAHVDSLARVPILLLHGDLYPHSPIGQAFSFRTLCASKGFSPQLIVLPGDGTLGLTDPIEISFSFFKGRRLP